MKQAIINILLFIFLFILYFVWFINDLKAIDILRESYWLNDEKYLKSEFYIDEEDKNAFFILYKYDGTWEKKKCDFILYKHDGTWEKKKCDARQRR